MGDMGDMYRDLKKIRQEQRANSRVTGTELVRARGYTFKTLNNGLHLVITAADSVMIDFWPSTGTWIATTKKGLTLRGKGAAKMMKIFPPIQESMDDGPDGQD